MRFRIGWMQRVIHEARFAALVAGAIIAGFGAGPASASPPIELSAITAGTGGFAIDGEAIDDFSGLSVCSAGDVNGDGLADLIVGAIGADSNGSGSGRSYVVFGKMGTTVVNLSAITAGTGGFVINGEAAEDRSGISVSGAGDVNGDGLADLIVGAQSADPNGSFSGRSYVVFGKRGTVAVQLSDITAGNGGFVMNGEAAGDFSGRRVCSAGDVNGDGLADLIVGARFAEPNGFRSGRSYVVFGKAGTTVVELSAITAGMGGFVINGEATYDNSGRSACSAGDVNGDGLADLIVSAPNADPNGSNSGRSYVVFGKKGTAAVNLSAITAAGAGGFTGGFAMNGEAFLDGSGWSACSAGDVNGDGLADLIVGAIGADSNGSGSGRSYVVFGKTGRAAVELSDITAGTGGFVINGEAADDSSGYSVSAAGDVNGDGLADLIVGARDADPNGSRSGRSYVVFGKTGTAAVELSAVTAGTGGFVMNGEALSDYSGRSVCSAGDVNGDGLADLIVGAWRADPNGDRSGRSYVIFSPETPPLLAPEGVARSAVYNTFSRAGDGPGGNPVVPTVIGDSRLTINWPDDDFGGSNFGFGSSKERIVLYRSNSPVRNLEPIENVARVCWGVITNRSGAGPAELTFKYVDHEIADIALGSEADLAIFAAEDFIGPWIRLPTIIDAARNTARATTDLGVFKHFALAESGATSVPPVNRAEHFEMYK